MAAIVARKNADGQIIGFQAKIRRNGVNQSKTFIKRSDAERWAREIEVEVERGVFLDRTEAERNTLGDLIAQYKETVSPSKKGGPTEIAGHIVPIQRDEICAIRMAQLGRKDVAAFRDRMLDAGLARATVTRRLNLVASVINHAIAEWNINVPSNPATAQMTKRPRGSDQKRDRRLVGDEEQRLFEKLGVETHAAYLIPLARLAIETAARQGELCSLHWSDIDLERRVMTVRGLSGDGSKNGEVRRVPLSGAAIDAIRPLPKKLRDERLFPIDQNTLKVAFLRAVKRAAIQDLTFHDLRHEAISRLAGIYTNPLELMRITGHKTLTMLSRYFHADAAELAKRLG